jgi:hypothetical protein
LAPIATVNAMLEKMGKRGEKYKKANRKVKAFEICRFLRIDMPDYAKAAVAAAAADADGAAGAGAASGADGAAGAGAASVANGKKPPKPAGPKPTKWETHVDSAGDTYYYNPSTGESTWDDPEPPTRPPKPACPKRAVVTATPHGGSSLAAAAHGAEMRGATIQYFQAGAFAAGSNVYMAAPGQNANQLAHAAQLAHGGAQISDPAGRRPLGDPRDHHHDPRDHHPHARGGVPAPPSFSSSGSYY